MLDAAGFDVFVFLEFFKMGIKYLSVSAVLGLGVVTPVKYHFTGDWKGNVTTELMALREEPVPLTDLSDWMAVDRSTRRNDKRNYLWAYFVFVYVFTGLAVYLLVQTSRKVARIRQTYLGNQSSITDRTVLLSGIPTEMRAESKVRQFMEGLRLGEVQSVVLCHKWETIDKLLARRVKILRRLEEQWTLYEAPMGLGSAVRRNEVSSSPNQDENGALLAKSDQRPRIKLGPFGMFGKEVDGIDHITNQLEAIDAKIRHIRAMDFEPQSTAFITFTSVAAAQLAAQTVLDPVPLRLVATLAPSPNDIIWSNTYQSGKERAIRSWAITGLTAAIAILWSFPLSVIAQLTDANTLRKFLPKVAEALESTELGKALVQGFLPTIAYIAFNACIPFFFEWLSGMQGFLSQGDVELSIVSKNFFYLFYNFFFFLVIKTIGTFYAIAKDATKLPYLLAAVLPGFSTFFMDLILLQGVGMFPFRLLQFGSLLGYSMSQIGCKTPRDYADLRQPPNFNFGFFLPQPILVFIICMCYSIISPWIVLIGAIYFIIGFIVFKYQLLYSMGHPSHSTGIIWIMIFHRLILGMIFYQLAMIGYLGLNKAYTLSILVVPLPFATVFLLGYNVDRAFKPPLSFIALRSLRESRRRRASQTVDEEREEGIEYINPNLVAPLESPWKPSDERSLAAVEQNHIV